MTKLIFIFAALFSLWQFSAGELTIFNTTDIHGRLQRTARLKSLYDRAAPDRRLIIDCGDAIQGTLESRLNHGEAMIELFNALNYDTWVPGNHDYEFGKPTLLQLIKKFKGKVIGNFYYEEYQAPLYQIITRSTLKIAIIGLTEYRAAERMMGDDAVKTIPYEQALKQAMPKIIAQKPDLIILAIHAGEYSFPDGIAGILKHYPEIDLVLCGHSHESVYGKSIGHAWLVQAGKHLDSVAEIKVLFNDKSKAVESIQSQLIAVDSLPVDPGLEQLFSTLVKDNPYPDKALAKRLKLGEIAPKILYQVSHADIAYFSCPKDSFHQTAPGTYAEIYQLLPFENYLCNIQLTESEFNHFMAEQAPGNKKRDLDWAFYPALPIPKTTFVLSTNNYILCNSPTLKEVIKDAPKKLHFLGKVERDVIFESMP